MPCANFSLPCTTDIFRTKDDGGTMKQKRETGNWNRAARRSGGTRRSSPPNSDGISCPGCLREIPLGGPYTLGCYACLMARMVDGGAVVYPSKGTK